MITAATRNIVRNVITASRYYDAATVRISRDGMVSARCDANKTCPLITVHRDVLGHVSDIVSDGWLSRSRW